MKKMKIAGIIMSVIAAVAFCFLYFRKPHTIGGAVAVLAAGFFITLGASMIAASEELNLEDKKDEK